MVEIIEGVIKYLLKMRFFTYVCQTERKNALGIKVIRLFYVDF